VKLAIVHDYLNQYGGAERVVEALHEAFPNAPIYTSIYLPKRMPESFQKMDIRTSFMQKLPFLMKHFKKYLMLYPKAFKSFDLSNYDVILSSSSAFAKGINKPSRSLHVCYCYTPMRFAWRYDDYIKGEKFGFITKNILKFFIKRLKEWDIRTNKSVDHFIGISKYISERIKNIYDRESVVIYPPVETMKYNPSAEISDYYLIVSRLNPYKKIEVAIKAFNKLGYPLTIIGGGPYKRHLMSIAGNNIEFTGKLSDNELSENYSKCKALIFPGEEDFGIVPVEAQAAGRPVIAYRSGGAVETVIENETGVFFNEQTEDSIVDAVRKFENMNFNSERIRQNARNFDKEIFKEKIKKYVSDKYMEFEKK